MWSLRLIVFHASPSIHQLKWMHSVNKEEAFTGKRKVSDTDMQCVFYFLSFTKDAGQWKKCCHRNPNILHLCVLTIPALFGSPNDQEAKSLLE